MFVRQRGGAGRGPSSRRRSGRRPRHRPRAGTRQQQLLSVIGGTGSSPSVLLCVAGAAPPVRWRSRLFMLCRQVSSTRQRRLFLCNRRGRACCFLQCVLAAPSGTQQTARSSSDDAAHEPAAASGGGPPAGSCGEGGGLFTAQHGRIRAPTARSCGWDTEPKTQAVKKISSG